MTIPVAIRAVTFIIFFILKFLSIRIEVMTIYRQPVSSSRVSSVGWENNVLEVEFKDGAVYQYYDVSQSQYQNFINSPSLGSELSRLDKVHRYKRV